MPSIVCLILALLPAQRGQITTIRHSVAVGIVVTSTADGKRYTAGTVVPANWPEQTVELTDKEVVRCTARIKEVVGGSLLIIGTKPLRAGEQARAIYRFHVETKSLPLPENPVESETRQAEFSTKSVREFLRPSPGIESEDATIQALARQLTAGLSTDWDKAKTLFDWVHQNIEYHEMDFTSARQALDSRTGDCEERASLFIALCRSIGIPARTVSCPGHCWAEFYLTNADTGQWLPAHTAGNPWFGHMPLPRVILQKGDNFRIAEHRPEPSRLLTSWYKGTLPKPTVEFIQDVKQLAE